MTERTTYVKLDCEVCEGEYERHRTNAENSRFCSIECQVSHRKENDKYPSGPDHGRWKGGVSKEVRRRRVLERDDHSCQRCGTPVGESDEAFELHHLIPRSAGGPDSDKNLVTLCVSCHKNAHRTMKTIHEERPEILEQLREVVCADA